MQIVAATQDLWEPPVTAPRLIYSRTNTRSHRNTSARVVFCWIRKINKHATIMPNGRRIYFPADFELLPFEKQLKNLNYSMLPCDGSQFKELIQIAS